MYFRTGFTGKVFALGNFMRNTSICNNIYSTVFNIFFSTKYLADILGLLLKHFQDMKKKKELCQKHSQCSRNIYIFIYLVSNNKSKNKKKKNV